MISGMITGLVTSHWPSKLKSSGKKFLKDLSVLSKNSSAEPESNSFVRESIANWLWSDLFDKIQHL